jgi:hypothetical protein
MNASELDLERNANYILARVLERGRLIDVRWLIRAYGLTLARLKPLVAKHGLYLAGGTAVATTSSTAARSTSISSLQGKGSSSPCVRASPPACRTRKW